MRACVAPTASCAAPCAAAATLPWSRRAARRCAPVVAAARAPPRPRLAAPPPALQLPPLRAVGAAALLASLAWAGAAHAADAGFAVGGLGGASGGVPDDDNYVYTTRDVAVDLASPLVAYRVASLAFNQEVPRWLDAIIFAAALGAAYVVVAGVDTLDKYLV